MKVQEKFAEARTAMKAALVERDDEIDLVLTALVCRENPLLVGPPGTAKSLLCDSLLDWLEPGAGKFSILFTKFSTPEEIFGPLDIPALKNSHYRRVTTSMLPEAVVGFGDEVFKASSAILNTLLKILNERTFQNNGSLVRVPLRLFIAASNEYPGDQEGGKELAALFDRFLLRKTVKPVASPEGRQRLLWERDHRPKFSSHISPAEIDQAHAESLAVTWTDEAKQALNSILHELKQQGVIPGDRRQHKSVGVAQAYAWLDGASEVTPEYLEVLAHVLWDDPQEQPKKAAEVISKVANPTGMAVNGLMLEAQEILGGNMGDTGTMITATKKLQSVAGKLRKIKTPKAKQALQYVEGKLKDLLVNAVSGGLV